MRLLTFLLSFMLPAPRPPIDLAITGMSLDDFDKLWRDPVNRAQLAYLDRKALRQGRPNAFIPE